MTESETAGIERDSDVVVVHLLPESLDADHLRKLQAQVLKSAEENPGLPFVLDMARINFVPSIALGTLVQIAGDFRSRRQRLMLAGMQSPVRDVFVMTRLDRLFEIQENVEAAVRSVRAD